MYSFIFLLCQTEGFKALYFFKRHVALTLIIGKKKTDTLFQKCFLRADFTRLDIFKQDALNGGMLNHAMIHLLWGICDISISSLELSQMFFFPSWAK